MSGIIIPSEAELKLEEGLFFNQIIVSKKDHATRWDVGKVVGISSPKFSKGSVLDLIDLITGYKYQELLVYVDFLVSIEIPSYVKMVYIDQLVTPCLCDGQAPEWLIGRVLAPMDGTKGSFSNYLVVDLQGGGEAYKVSVSDINLLTRVESFFPPEM